MVLVAVFGFQTVEGNKKAKAKSGKPFPVVGGVHCKVDSVSRTTDDVTTVFWASHFIDSTGIAFDDGPP